MNGTGRRSQDWGNAGGPLGTRALALLGMLLLTGMANAGTPICYTVEATGTSCCDQDGDLVTEECLAFAGIFVLDAWCNEHPEEPCPADPGCTATLSDGLTTLSGCLVVPDCDDQDPARVPSLPGLLFSAEVCDGKDNNCDAEIDEDFDLDDDSVTIACLDGYAYWTGETTEKCDPSTGDVSPNEACRIQPDCDDLDPQTYPPNPLDPTGGLEVCDGQDQDCDKLIDEVFDQDQDGVSICAGDCNDNDAMTYPGATEEYFDGIDHNCDGIVRCGVDSDGDGYRPDAETYVDSNDADCDDIGEATEIVPLGDCDDADGSVNPAASERMGDEKDQNCDGRESCPSDKDNDGFRPDSSSRVNSKDLDCQDSGEATISDPIGDCNDSDPAINPGADESPADGVDFDCDQQELCFVDADDDGYRPDRGTTILSDDMDCDDTSEAGSSDPSGDCNDSSAAIRPGQTEFPDDGIDQNCDGMESCYLDKDADGFRPDSYSTISSPDFSCSGPGAANASVPVGDCDDSSPETYPLAAEIPGDGSDQSCDGRETCFLDGDMDGYLPTSPELVESEDVDCLDPGEGGVDSPRGDCNDSMSELSPGTPEICDGLDNNCQGSVDETYDLDQDGVTLCGQDGNIETPSDNDCDDENSSIYPGATERCDGVDQNCNDRVDEGEGLDAVEWWIDQDLDGFGSSTISKIQCDYPAGYVPRPTDPTLEDCNDFDPSVHPGSGNERLDGSDSDCDGRMPVIELDCDDDGQLPISRLSLAVVQADEVNIDQVQMPCNQETLYPEVTIGAMTSIGIPNDSLTDATTLGLRACQQGDVPPELTCLGLDSPKDFRLVCDDMAFGGTGFWLIDRFRDVLPLFNENRTVPVSAKCDSRFSDCDDQWSTVCGCRTEVCDGRDSNCAENGVNGKGLSRVDVWQGGDGIPDAMQILSNRSGAVSQQEMDADSDGVLACLEGETLDKLKDDQAPWAQSGQGAAWKYGDCDDRCALRSPNAESLCDGIADNICAAVPYDPWLEAESDSAHCGFMSDEVQQSWDSLYIVAFQTCSSCQEGLPQFVPLTPLRNTLPLADEADSVCEDPAHVCALRDPATLALDSALSRVAADLSGPSVSGTCSPPLLTKAGAAENPALELLRLCLPDRTSGASYASLCQIVQLRLSADANAQISQMYPSLIEQSSTLCASAYTARALWPADRIRQAREVVALWDCIQSGECRCADGTESGQPIYSDCKRITAAPTSQWKRVPYVSGSLVITQEASAVDIGAFLDSTSSAPPGWTSGCWTSTSSIGGACAGGSRDQAEGPRDILARLTGTAVDCRTCTDGQDNNCNGLADAEDPGCYPCLQAQGVSCSCTLPANGLAAIPTGGDVAQALLLIMSARVLSRRRPGSAR